jgi:hypothetical protein
MPNCEAAGPCCLLCKIIISVCLCTHTPLCVPLQIKQLNASLAEAQKASAPLQRSEQNLKTQLEKTQQVS